MSKIIDQYINGEVTPKAEIPPLQAGLSKTIIAVKADLFVSSVLENGNIVNAVEAIAVMEEFIDKVRKDERFVDYARIELEKEHGKITTPSGAVIQKCEVGVRYDYSQDEQWRIINDSAQEISSMLKARETYLKGIPEGKDVVDQNTGEVIAVGPCKSSKSSYKITLKK